MAEFRIFKRQLALDLRKAGFKIVRVEPNEKKPFLDTYYFEDTETFRQALTNLTKLAKWWIKLSKKNPLGILFGASAFNQSEVNNYDRVVFKGE